MNAVLLNTLYASAQTVLIVAYGALFLLDDDPAMFTSPWARGVGFACCLGGLLLMALAFIELRSVIQIAPQPREGGRLITSGVYRRFRHPIYTGIFAIVVGLFLRKPTQYIGLATLLVIGFLILKSAYEERLLVRRYPEYVEYKRQTFGVVPILT